MEDSVKIVVKNREGNGPVGYTIPDMGNLQRVYQDGESKTITFEEIRKLSYVPGGLNLIKDYLIIDNKQVLQELNYKPEPEYFYTKEDIIKLMQTGTLDEFLDCLDFAPQGVLESIKDFAVNLPLNDVAKRKAIEQKLHFNVDNAIRNKALSEEKEEKETAEATSKRRVVSTKSGKTAGRRVTITENK